VTQIEGRARGLQARHRPRRACGLGLGAEEEQVARQLLLHSLARLAGPGQREQPGGDALGVDIGPQGGGGLRLEEGGGELPQGGLVTQGAGPQAGAELAQARQRLAVGLAHEREHQRLELRAGRAVHALRHHARLVGQRDPPHVERPEVGRMDALGARQLLQRPVLRKEGERGDTLARQHVGQVVEHRKRAAFDAADRFGRDERAVGGEAHHGRLGRAHHTRRRTLADEFQGACGLVQRLSRRTQDRGVDDVALGAVQALAQVAAQRLVRLLQRLAQFLAQPPEHAQVGPTVGSVGPVGGGRGF
jgi:hypothetical protein